MEYSILCYKKVAVMDETEYIVLNCIGIIKKVVDKARLSMYN